MEKKKSLKANLEKSKTSFLMIGFIVAVSLMIYAFNYESIEKFVNVTNNELIIDEEFATITKPEDEKQNEKPEKPIPKKVIAEVIKLVHDSTKITEPYELWNPDDTVIFDDPVIIEIDSILPTSEIKPKFPGGELALRHFVANNVIYPAAARENGIEGTVYLRFEVTKNGYVGKTEILNKTQDALLQEAAKDVIKKLPKFKPGMQNGQKVNVWYSIPISFKLK